MNTPHAKRTQAQVLAIKETLDAITKDSNEQFLSGMQFSRTVATNEKDPNDREYSYIAGKCLIANNIKAVGSTINQARELMGLTIQQSKNLFTPHTKQADTNCNDEYHPTFISKIRTIIMLSLLYHEGIVSWKKEILMAHRQTAGRYVEKRDAECQSIT